MLAAPADETLALADGRRLGYTQYGDPNGKPVFYFHGMPGSRIEGELGHEAAARAGVHLIAIDRPGYGLSDFQAKRAFLDWPDDVVALASAHGVQRFGVVGISGGGPYVSACAYKIPERLAAAGIVAGVGPFDQPDATEGMSGQNRALFKLALRIPWLVRPPLALMGMLARRFPDRMMKTMIRSLPAPDQAALARPEVMALFKRETAESFRQGARGAAWETLMYARPWGFRLEDIKIEVHLWQGELDRNVPPSMGRYQARTIPNCCARFYPDEGHISLAVNRIDEILTVLAGKL